MQPLEKAILRTLIYADLFQFPLTESELHWYLIHHEPVSLEVVLHTLAHSAGLNTVLHRAEGYIALEEHASIIAQRQQREQYAQANWSKAERYGRWLAHIPFVRMVALTGALAVRNPSSHNDDYDYFLVTLPGRVWMARLFAVVLVRIVRLWGDEICPNYVLAADKLEQKRCDLFIAHEIVQMHLIFGEALYSDMIAANRWTSVYLPNAQLQGGEAAVPHRLKRLAEKLLQTRLGNWIETWEYQRKTRQFAPRTARKPDGEALIDESHVKGHFDDFGLEVMRRYETRLQAYDLHDAATIY